MFWGYILSILTALSFGINSTYKKSVAHQYPSTFLSWGSFIFSFMFMFPALLIDGIPEIQWFDFIWASLISGAVNLIATNLFFRALALAPLYLTIPFTALTPLFLLPISYLTLGESPGTRDMLGISLVVFGVYSIQARSGAFFQPFVDIFRVKGTRYMFIVALLWALSATFDKVAILSSSPTFYGVTLYLLMAISYFPYIYFYHPVLLKKLPSHSVKLLIIGGFTSFTLLCQFSALQYLEVSHVIAFKRAGIIVSILLGYWFLEEHNLLKHLAATVLILSGAILLMI